MGISDTTSHNKVTSFIPFRAFLLCGIANPTDSHHQRGSVSNEPWRDQLWNVLLPSGPCALGKSRAKTGKGDSFLLPRIGLASVCFTQLSTNTRQPFFQLWVGSCQGECFKLVKFLGSTAGSQQKQTRTSNKLRALRSKDISSKNFLMSFHV